MTTTTNPEVPDLRHGLRHLLTMLENVVAFAYEHGYHEHGVPLVTEVREYIAALEQERESLRAAIVGRLTPAMLTALAAECDDVGRKSDNVLEVLNDARAALARAGAPHSPEQDRDGLYYPLLFLVKRLEAFDAEFADPGGGL